jgi:hypothetical protein
MYASSYNPMMSGANPMIMGGMSANPMMGMMMSMQLMQMMEIMQMMMGQQQNGNGAMQGGNPAFQYGQMMGMEAALSGAPPMPFPGMPMPGMPPQFGNYYPRPRGEQPNFGALQANPGADVPDFGPSPNKQQIDEMLNAACEKYGVPPQVAKAVAYQESGWNPKASSFDGGHGKGIMQIDDRSHDFARTGNVWNPGENIDYGVRLLAQNYQKSGGDWHSAIRHYNGAGPAAEKYAGKVMGLAQQEPWQRWGVA